MILRGDLPVDEVTPVDPELREMQALWAEARERQLGHLSAYSFDLRSDPPGVQAPKQ